MMASLLQTPPRGDRPPKTASHKTASRSCAQSRNGVAALYEQISDLQNSLERSRNENIKLRMLLKAHCETRAISVTSRRSSFGDDLMFDYEQPGEVSLETGRESQRESLSARPVYRNDYRVGTSASATPLRIVPGAADSTVDAKLPSKRPLAQPRMSRPPVKCQHHVSFEIVANDEMCCAPSPKPMDITIVRKKSTDVQPENPECTSPDVRPKKQGCTVTTGCF